MNILSITAYHIIFAGLVVILYQLYLKTSLFKKIVSLIDHSLS